MPKTLSIDYAAARAGFVKGISLIDLAKEHGCNLGSLRSRAQREGWGKLKAKAEQSMLQVSQEAGIQHVSKVARHVSSKLDELMQFDYVSAFKTLDAEGFVRSLNTLDLIARRAYRLDEPTAKTTSLVQINVNGGADVARAITVDTEHAEASDKMVPME